ncbi:MAG: YicC/YloC family endoribonuclease [Bacteroidales bacterium]
MIQSMTGFGKSEVTCGTDKYTVEIRTLNGKNCDISLKSQLIPKDKELKIRKKLSQKLLRGNIDIYLTLDQTEASSNVKINKQLFKEYYTQLRNVSDECKLGTIERTAIVNSIVRLPEVIEIQKSTLSEENYEKLEKSILEAADDVINYRIKEGEILKKDISAKVNQIYNLVTEIEKYEKERITTIKTRLKTNLEELGTSVDQNRFEQEIIYYLEKLDINEEKVRLRQHCKYFIETMDKEFPAGKKLAFIAQEIGREVNTMGSKSNNSDMQKIVVNMKDALEKIKEQSFNIL